MPNAHLQVDTVCLHPTATLLCNDPVDHQVAVGHRYMSSLLPEGSDSSSCWWTLTHMFYGIFSVENLRKSLITRVLSGIRLGILLLCEALQGCACCHAGQPSASAISKHAHSATKFLSKKQHTQARSSWELAAGGMH